MHDTTSGSFSGNMDPAVRGAPVETLASTEELTRPAAIARIYAPSIVEVGGNGPAQIIRPLPSSSIGSRPIREQNPRDRALSGWAGATIVMGATPGRASKSLTTTSHSVSEARFPFVSDLP